MVIQMNKIIIKNFISKLTHNDIKTFSKKQNILLNDDEIKLIETYIKQNWHTIIYEDPKPIFDKLKKNINESEYIKIEKLYIEFKNKYKNYL